MKNTKNKPFWLSWYPAKGAVYVEFNNILPVDSVLCQQFYVNNYWTVKC